MAKEAATIELIWDLMRGRTEGISRVDYVPQKPAFPEALPYEQPFPRTSPESQGIHSRQIEELFRELKSSKELHMHNVMILKGGKVIGETAFYPYRQELWHAAYSMCKSVTSMAVGLLISEGKLTLDTKVVDIFRKNVSLFGFIRQKDLTVRHLLTMTSGVSFNETGAISGNDWVKSYLEAFCHHEPGTFFEYNSMNTYMLSAILTEMTGETVLEYLTPRLFVPMGIKKVFWESCPKGNNKGGWGLFLCVEDMAKLGQLYLDAGKWKGQQLIPEDWVRESVSSKVVPPENTGFPGYGYQIWTCKRAGQFAFNGMLGQNVFVYPDVDMVVVTTAGNEVLFNSNVLQDVLEEHLPSESAYLPPLPEDKKAYQSLLTCQQELSGPSPAASILRHGGWSRRMSESRRDCRSRKDRSFLLKTERQGMEMAYQAPGGAGKRSMEPADIRRFQHFLDGKRYVMMTPQVGLFTLMGQVFHNNYTDGIRELGFHLEKSRFFLDIREGEKSFSIPAGFEKAEYSVIDFHGEPYLDAVEGRFAFDEDGRLVLELNIYYLEDAIRRRIKIFFEEEEMEVHFSEVPGKKILLDGLGSLTAALSENTVVRKIREKGNVDLLRLAMETTLEPVVRGKRII